MGLVNQLRMHDDIETLKDLVCQIVAKVEKEIMRYAKVGLVFDRYDTLKTIQVPSQR